VTAIPPAKFESVLVTDAKDGLGRAPVILLAERGYPVSVRGRSAGHRVSLDEFARSGLLRKQPRREVLRNATFRQTRT